MKKLLILVPILLTGCVQLATLKVVNGLGSGKYDLMERVQVIANDPPDGTLFDEWEGDISGIEKRDMATTWIVMNQISKEIYPSYTNEIPPLREVINPDCGPNAAGTYSEFFRNKYQYQSDGHAGAHWRCKFAWPSYANRVFNVVKHSAGPCSDPISHLTCKENITRVYKGDTWELLAACPVYAIDPSETGLAARPNSEWFDPVVNVPIRVELWKDGVPVMRVYMSTASTQYQGPLKDRI